jgi:hypothetical protein
MEEFPNTNADVGYFGSVLGGEREQVTVDQTVVFLKELADRSGSPLRQRLMYGSNWSMIGAGESTANVPAKSNRGSFQSLAR